MAGRGVEQNLTGGREILIAEVVDSRQHDARQDMEGEGGVAIGNVHAIQFFRCLAESLQVASEMLRQFASGVTLEGLAVEPAVRQVGIRNPTAFDWCSIGDGQVIKQQRLGGKIRLLAIGFENNKLREGHAQWTPEKGQADFACSCLGEKFCPTAGGEGNRLGLFLQAGAQLPDT